MEKEREISSGKRNGVVTLNSFQGLLLALLSFASSFLLIALLQVLFVECQSQTGFHLYP